MMNCVPFCVLSSTYNFLFFIMTFVLSLNVLRKSQVIEKQRSVSLMNKLFNYILVLLYTLDYKIAEE